MGNAKKYRNDFIAQSKTTGVVRVIRGVETNAAGEPTKKGREAIEQAMERKLYKAVNVQGVLSNPKVQRAVLDVMP